MIGFTIIKNRKKRLRSIKNIIGNNNHLTGHPFHSCAKSTYEKPRKKVKEQQSNVYQFDLISVFRQPMANCRVGSRHNIHTIRNEI